MLPFVKRPRVGIRWIVKTHFGSFVGAICKDIGNENDWDRALDLMRICLLLVEDGVTDFLHDILHALMKHFLLQKAEIPFPTLLNTVFHLIGVFGDPKTLHSILEIILEDTHSISGSVKIYLRQTIECQSA